LLDGKKTSCWEYTISTSLRKEIREEHEIYRRDLVAHRVGQTSFSSEHLISVKGFRGPLERGDGF